MLRRLLHLLFLVLVESGWICKSERLISFLLLLVVGTHPGEFLVQLLFGKRYSFLILSKTLSQRVFTLILLPSEEIRILFFPALCVMVHLIVGLIQCRF